MRELSIDNRERNLDGSLDIMEEAGGQKWISLLPSPSPAGKAIGAISAHQQVGTANLSYTRGLPATFYLSSDSDC